MEGGLVSVWLIRFAPEALPAAAERIVHIFGIDDRAADALLGSLPAPVKSQATPEQARQYRDALVSIGGEVEIRPLDGEARGAALTAAPPPRIEAPGGPPAAAATRPHHGEVCIEHADTDATSFCARCKFSWCRQCGIPSGPSGALSVCKRCREVLDRYVEPHAVTTIGGYVSEIPASFTFIARKDVLFLLIATAVLVWPIAAMSAMPGNMYGLIGSGIKFAIEAALFLHLVRQVALDADEINSPDFTNVYDDLGHPTLRYLFACLPMIAAFFWTASIALGDALFVGAITPTDLSSYRGPLLLFVVGFLAWPITTLIAAMSASALSVINPLEWIRTARQIGTPLLIGAPIFYVYVVFEAIVIGGLASELLAISYVGRLLALFVTYLALAIRARLIGALIIGRV